MKTLLVSACLLGCPCRYDGKSVPNEKVLALREKYHLVPVCPEQLGGLPTPREPSERVGSRVKTKSGADFTQQFEAGAAETLYIAQTLGAEGAILKAYSPSCGKGTIYDGTFSHTKIPGSGVTARLLLENGIAVYTEDETDQLPSPDAEE
ncbi:MAG: DUF523 domain-containing protein [Clostridia bacterium]|nr:DUF523 domain-containing protein [Clostridia bacterium]